MDSVLQKGEIEKLQRCDFIIMWYLRWAGPAKTDEYGRRIKTKENPNEDKLVKPVYELLKDPKSRGSIITEQKARAIIKALDMEVIHGDYGTVWAKKDGKFYEKWKHILTDEEYEKYD